ncbi:MAG: discoidin domain-containing protein [Methylobacter sp.]|nr:discoidin domain-containing protein [Methylobacter sp.]MDP2429936.1 discoidin domain-containing protein [Methylobacter sp.]MDP3056319.1 discoidin domain-containing protein [Methylobacter sp.]MDP3362866.1 discoidin domain-containing protein [Methylobacter sp.]
MKRHILFTLLASSIMTTVNASPVLTEDFRLSIPYLRWQQTPSTSIGLTAELTPRIDEASQLYFDVQSYAIIPDASRPPMLKALSHIVNDGSLQVTPLDAQTAEIVFRSTIPIICSVVYGTTPDFGQLATNPNMMVSASLDHQLQLTDLQANTEYFYRIQSIDTQGTLYFSETRSFVADAEVADKSVNIASLAQGARVVAVSSQFGGGDYDNNWGANKALDGLASTAWSSMGDGDNAFIEIELTEPQLIGQLGVWSRSMSDGSARIQTFTITLDSGETKGPFVLPDAQQMHYFELNRSAQRIRFAVETSTGGNTGLIEFAAFLR